MYRLLVYAGYNKHSKLRTIAKCSKDSVSAPASRSTLCGPWSISYPQLPQLLPASEALLSSAGPFQASQRCLHLVRLSDFSSQALPTISSYPNSCWIGQLQKTLMSAQCTLCEFRECFSASFWSRSSWLNLFCTLAVQVSPPRSHSQILWCWQNFQGDNWHPNSPHAAELLDQTPRTGHGHVFAAPCRCRWTFCLWVSHQDQGRYYPHLHHRHLPFSFCGGKTLWLLFWPRHSLAISASSLQPPASSFLFPSPWQQERMKIVGKLDKVKNPPALPACLVEWGLMMDCLSVLCFCL